MEVLFVMIDRVDLLIAVIGIVVSVLGSSTAMWIALAKKADRADLDRLETKLDGRLERFETKFDARMDRLDGRMDRFETKLDTLIMRFVPEHLPEPGQ